MERLLPVVASSAEVVGSSEVVWAKVVRLYGIGELEKSVYQGSVLNNNRAPPRISGMGSSDTYLFKRTLLI
ncbi:MAG: hypothetical protein HY711_06075 [Candidatus Melainabacteria bacterium]|nr:hypothetical protein [Candidatus Melainabacteria bacterium]